MDATNHTKTIAVVAPYFPPDGGGLERYALEISKRLHKNHGWRVIVITSGERYGTNKLEEVDGLKIYRLSYNLKISNAPFAFSWFKEIKAILKQENPDVINIHAPVPGIGDVTALLAGKRPVILTYHAGSMRKGKFATDCLVWLYEHIALKKLLARANKIVCSSDFVRFGFLPKYSFKSTTISPGVDTELFRPDLTKRNPEPTVLFVAGLGRTEQHKGLNKLIDAINILKQTIPNIKLIVVGEGDMRCDYEARVKALGLEENISFAGRLGEERLTAKYQKAHVFCLPSCNESFSMVILEAMASALPVVATHVGGIPTLVNNDETGFTIPAESTAFTLAQKLSYFINNPEIAKKFGDLGRIKTINKYDWQIRAKQYHQICHELITNETTTESNPTQIQTIEPSSEVVSDKKITVIILTNNSAKTIDYCLESLNAQTNKDFEILIVDDDSTDNTLELIKEICENKKLIFRIIKNGTHNISKGRNLGIKASQTTLVAFLDSDDRADTLWIDTILKTFAQNPTAAFLSGTIIPVANTATGQSIANNDSVIRNLFGKGILLFNTANSAFNKSVLKPRYYFDEDFIFAEDLEIASRLKKDYRWIFVPEMKVYQTSRGDLAGYAKQMYRYGKWKTYFGYVYNDFRFIDFIPLSIFIFSLIACLGFRHWLPLLTLPLFSLAEALFVIIVTRRNLKISALSFPGWLVKNLFWSLGVAEALTTLLLNPQLRKMFDRKKLQNSAV